MSQEDKYREDVEEVKEEGARKQMLESKQKEQGTIKETNEARDKSQKVKST